MGNFERLSRTTIILLRSSEVDALMLAYALDDTYHLLYVADRLKVGVRRGNLMNANTISSI